MDKFQNWIKIFYFHSSYLLCSPIDGMAKIIFTLRFSWNSRNSPCLHPQLLCPKEEITFWHCWNRTHFTCMSSLAGNCFINFAMASRAIHSDLSCSRSLPLAGTRWVQLTLESLCPLLLAVPSINLSNIKIKILGNVGYRIRGWWVRSKSVTSVLCSPPIQFRSFLARNWPPAGLGRLTASDFSFRRCPKLSSARFNRRLTRPKTLGLSLTYILSLSLYLTHTHTHAPLDLPPSSVQSSCVQFGLFCPSTFLNRLRCWLSLLTVVWRPHVDGRLPEPV